MCPHVPLCVPPCPSAPPHVSPRPSTCPHVPPRVPMPLSVPPCPSVSPHVCPRGLCVPHVRVPLCPHVPPRVPMRSLGPPTCPHVPLRPPTSLCVPPRVPTRSLCPHVRVPLCPHVPPRVPTSPHEASPCPRPPVPPFLCAAPEALCRPRRFGAASLGLGHPPLMAAPFPPAVPELHPAAVRQEGGRRLRGVHVAHGGLLRLQLLRFARLRPPAEPASGLDTAASGSGIGTAASGSRSPSLRRPPPRARSPPPLYSPASLVANKRLRFVRTNRVAPFRHRALPLADEGPFRYVPPPQVRG